MCESTIFNDRDKCRLIPRISDRIAKLIRHKDDIIYLSNKNGELALLFAWSLSAIFKNKYKITKTASYFFAYLNYFGKFSVFLTDKIVFLFGEYVSVELNHELELTHLTIAQSAWMLSWSVYCTVDKKTKGWMLSWFLNTFPQHMCLTLA